LNVNIITNYYIYSSQTKIADVCNNSIVNINFIIAILIRDIAL